MDTLIRDFGVDSILDCLADSEAKRLERECPDFIRGLEIGYRFFAGIGDISELKAMLSNRDINALLWRLIQSI